MCKDKFKIFLLIYTFLRPLLYTIGYLVIQGENYKELFHIVDIFAIIIFITGFLLLSFTSSKSFYTKYFVTLFISYILIILYIEIRFPYYSDGKVLIYIYYLICFIILSFSSIVIFYINRKIKLKLSKKEKKT